MSRISLRKHRSLFLPYLLVCAFHASSEPAAAVDDSAFLSQQVPATLVVGEIRQVSVTILNSGSTTWTRAGGYKLGTQNPRDNRTWTGGTRVYLSNSDTISPGQQKTFVFDIIAPTTPGTYDFQWQMVKEGVTWFGDYTHNLSIEVTPQPSNDAVFLSQDVPSLLNVGEIRRVSITLRNTGSTTWTRAELYKLASQNPADNTTWTGGTRIYLSSSEAIAPGQQKTFNFDIIAPMVAGSYNFQWRMVKEGAGRFGDYTSNVVIEVMPQPSNDAAFLSQDVPSLLNAGEIRRVSITLRNTGSTTWTRAELYKLASQNPADNTTWTGGTRIYLSSSEAIAPGQQKTFNFDIIAPVVAGSYNFQWRMVKEGAGRFGDYTSNVVIEVVPLPANDAAFLSQDVPTTLTAGEIRSVSVTLRNTGSTTWTRVGGYKLGSQNPRDNTIWTGGARIYLTSADSIAPNQEKTSTFEITAPSTPGSYNFEWQMLKEGVEWFGENTANIVVEILPVPLFNDAKMLSQNVPVSLGIGEVRGVSVTMKNTGTTSWSREAKYRLGSQNPPRNTTWTGSSRIELDQGEVVAPGESMIFFFQITAPMTPGTYNFQWRMVEEGVEWFGEKTPNTMVEVSVPPVNASKFIGQSLPGEMEVGESVDVAVTIRNSGTTIWSGANGYKLGSENPRDNNRWTGNQRVALDPGEEINPNQEKTFTFTVTAPSKPGLYNFQWQMVQEGVEWFGERTVNKLVTVNPPGISCGLADHSDSSADDSVIQCLLDGGGRVEIAPGSPGYLIAQGLEITVDGTEFASTDSRKANLVAHESLGTPILEIVDHNDTLIERLVFDGNKDARRGRVIVCEGYRGNGSNILVKGKDRNRNTRILNIESVHALCGTALSMSATYFEVAGSVFRDNGERTKNFPTEEPWADGITLATCIEGWVHDNIVEDSTDIGIVSGGGAGCSVERNVIRQISKFARGGLAVHNFSASGGGQHIGSAFRYNEIYANLDMLQFGITIGMHWWKPERQTVGGVVEFNTVSGAQINLSVDGYIDGTVDNNILQNEQGDYGGCSSVTNLSYAVGHVDNTCLECGWVETTFDGGSCSSDGGSVSSNCHVCW